MVQPAYLVQPAEMAQPAEMTQPAEMVQPADFSSRLSGLKAVIKLNNNIVISFLIIAIMSNRSESSENIS